MHGGFEITDGAVILGLCLGDHLGADRLEPGGLGAEPVARGCGGLAGGLGAGEHGVVAGFVTECIEERGMLGPAALDAETQLEDASGGRGAYSHVYLC